MSVTIKSGVDHIIGQQNCPKVDAGYIYYY